MVATKQALTEAVLWPLQHPDTFARLASTRPRRSALRATRMRQDVRGACAGQLGPAQRARSQGRRADGQVGGSSEKAVRELFRRARDSAPSLVFLDEVDALARDAVRASTPAWATAWWRPADRARRHRTAAGRCGARRHQPS